jgi:PhoPQ-activated pathogenicity-related protein
MQFMTQRAILPLAQRSIVAGIFALLATASGTCHAQSIEPGRAATMLAEGSPSLAPAGQLTALERYVKADDKAFSWKCEVSTHFDGPGSGTWHALRMTSQIWRTKGEVDFPEWTHWVNVWMPDTLTTDRPMLFIGGGRRRAEVPSAPPKELEMFRASGAIIIAVDNVPNQPMKLDDDPAERTEDGLVARSWLKAMETGDPTWIARFPMVKAAVKAMDAFEAFIRSNPPKGTNFNGKALAEGFAPGPYLVAGGSKRGWTTWLTAAIDPRVGALAPLVIDVLDLPVQMKHHHDAYGFWSPALNDYVETGFTDKFGGKTPDARLTSVLLHDDPINWLSRVGSKPKLLINAADDEFFLPDSAQFYVDRLPAPWHLRYEPNTGHGLKNSSAVADLIAFHLAWALNAPIPELTWKATPAGSEHLTLEVHAATKPDQVRLWTAVTKGTRDFRIDTIGKSWQSSELKAADEGGLTYIATLDAPADAFKACFVEATFAAPKTGLPPQVYTTQIYVLPDRLPFAKTK